MQGLPGHRAYWDESSRQLVLLLSLVTALIWAAAWANIVVHCHWSRLLCGFAQVPCAAIVSLQLYFQVGANTCLKLARIRQISSE